MAERNSLPKWALTSFPGSGVTWTRQMIEGLTGIYTGSVHVGDPLPFRENCNLKNVTIIFGDSVIANLSNYLR